MGELGTLIGGLAISRMRKLSAMVDYPAEWRRLAQEFYDIPDPQENLRAFKKDGRWQLTGGISAEHDPARIRYRYRSLAERAAALAGTKTGSLEEWLELLATKGPPHETRRGGADAPKMAGVVLHPHIPAIERLSIVSADFCKRLEAEAFADVVCMAPKSEESALSQPAIVAETEARPANDPDRRAPPRSGRQAVEEPGFSDMPGPAEVIKAPAIPVDSARLTAISVQGTAEGAMAESPENTRAVRHDGPQFQIDLASLDRDFSKRAGEQALTGGRGAVAAEATTDVESGSTNQSTSQPAFGVSEPPVPAKKNTGTTAQEAQGPQESHKGKKPVRRNARYEGIDEALREIAAARPKNHEELVRFLENRKVAIPNRKVFKSAGGWLKGFQQNPHDASAWLSQAWRRLGLPAFARGPKK